MATYDLTDFLEDDAVVLEGVRSDAHPEGRAYRFESPSFEVGLWLKNLVEFGQKAAIRQRIGGDLSDTEKLDLAKDVGKLVLDDDEEMDVMRRVMGDTLDEMRADGVKWENVQKIFTLLLKKWGNSQPIEVTLEEGKGAAPNREMRRAAAKKAPAKAPAKRSSPKAGSKSSRARTGPEKALASSGANSRAHTPATGRGSTRSSATSVSTRGAATA